MEQTAEPTGVVEFSLAGRIFPVRRPRVLDVGGGSGSTTVDLARQGAEVTVVDRSADALAMLERRADDSRVRVTGIQGDAENLGRVVPDASFDVVLLHRLLEAVDDPAAVLQAAVGAAVPGGLVSVTVPSLYSLVLDHLRHGRLSSFGAALPDGGPLPGWSAAELQALATAAGLETVALVGLDLWTLVDSDARVESVEPQLRRGLERRAEIDPVLRELCPVLQVVGTVPGR